VTSDQDRSIGPSEEYRLLVEGRITPSEYAARLKLAVAKEEDAGTFDEPEDVDLLAGPTVFLSYSHEDRDIARGLAIELEKRGAAVWIDEGELRIGDSLVERIAGAITEVEYVAVLVSKASVQSNWCQRELSLASASVLARQGVKVLPLRLGKAQMPPSLSDLVYLEVDAANLPDAANRLVADIRRHHAERLSHGIPKAADQKASGHPTGLSWHLPEEVLIQRVLTAAKQNDEMSFAWLMNSLSIAIQEGESYESVTAMLDRLTAVIAVLLMHDATDWVLRAAKGYEKLYASTFTQYGTPRTDLGCRPEELWLAVLVRIEAVGGLAVRVESWLAVKELALLRTEGGGETGYYPFLLRHGLTMAARAGLFERADGPQRTSISLIHLAWELSRTSPALTLDSPIDKDAALSSVCAFDFLAALIAMGEADSTDGRIFYTNFARFNTSRVEKVLGRVLADASTRRTLFTADEKRLSFFIRVLDRRAQSEGLRFDGWSVFTDSRVLSLLEAHPVDDHALRQALL
jgi:hypothetical protein